MTSRKLYFLVLCVTILCSAFQPGGSQNQNSSNKEHPPAQALPQAKRTTKLQGAGKVYFVPLGEFPPALIEEFVAHYKQRLGLTIEVLPKIEYLTAAADYDRQQYVAEELVTLMKRRYPELAADPTAVMIGLMKDELYARVLLAKFDWQYLYAFRTGRRFGVITSCYFDPTYWRQPADDELMRKRLRKMVTKYIGVLHYQLPVSKDPRSVLYDKLYNLRAVDRAGEDF